MSAGLSDTTVGLIIGFTAGMFTHVIAWEIDQWYYRYRKKQYEKK